jgi:uncharacterized protein DUF6249
MRSIPRKPADARRRRLVLGAAVAAVILAGALLPESPAVRAQAPIVAQASPGSSSPPAASTPSAPATTRPSESASKASPAAPAPDAQADVGAAGEPETTLQGGHHGIIIEKGDKKIRVEGLGFTPDREYDSFEQFVRQAPRAAAIFFATLMIVFLVPLLIVVLLIWYKLRKNRLANETMLKLAERGVVPPATAMDAVASGNAPAMAAAVGGTSDPAYNYVRAAHRRAAWSDLRKGVILTAIGLGLSLWSILDDGTANSVGLILLFLGLGYCVLWFFEDRTAMPGGTPPPGRVQ